MSWPDFFAMGGYALYVWGAYGLALVVLALNVLLPWRRHKAVRRHLAEYCRLNDEAS
jgi:heme exporter protein D